MNDWGDMTLSTSGNNQQMPILIESFLTWGSRLIFLLKGFHKLGYNILLGYIFLHIPLLSKLIVVIDTMGEKLLSKTKTREAA